MPPLPASQSPHVLRWVRETLDLTQGELASLLGASEPTIRAIESGRMTLSPKFSLRLSSLTGIHASKLARNNLGNPPPPPSEIRKHFAQAQKALDFSPGGPMAKTLLLTAPLRSFVLQVLIAQELGPEGCLHAGFFDSLQKTTAKLLWKVPNSKTRLRIFERSREMSDEEILAYAEKAIDALRDSKAINELLNRKY